MEDLIKLVSEKAGITIEQAKQAVESVMGFLKDKLPADVMNQLSSLMGGLGDAAGKAAGAATDAAGKATGAATSAASSAAGTASDVTGKIGETLGGVFGKKSS